MEKSLAFTLEFCLTLRDHEINDCKTNKKAQTKEIPSTGVVEAKN
jgi:hypothetical protein